MLTPEPRAMKLEDEIVRCVFDSADLLEHDLTFEFQV
jgi:hypothetical protein